MSGFEVYRKQRVSTMKFTEPTVRVTPRRLIVFRAAAMPLIEGATHVQLLFDRDTGRAAMRPADAEAQAAYSISRNTFGANAATVSAVAFVRSVELAEGDYRLQLEDELLVMEPLA